MAWKTTDSSERPVLISEDFRTMRIPNTEIVLGCVGDHGVRRVYFEAPRYCASYDMVNFAFQVHFENAQGDGDYYQCTDMEVSDDTILFSWVPSSVAFAASGIVNASVRAFDDGGEDEFNTLPGQFKVLTTLREEAAGSPLVDDSDNLIVLTVEEA